MNANLQFSTSGAVQPERLLPIYEAMRTAREVDILEASYTGRGEAFFHVSGAGHEAVATLNAHLNEHDWLSLHYRDKALMLARGISAEQFFLSLFCKDGSHSRGRQMSAHMSDRSLNIMSLVGPVGNNALQAVGVAQQLKAESKSGVVICSLGDGTSQEGEVLESIAEAVRSQLPMLFLIEDNRLAISTLTVGKTLYSTPAGEADEFYGLPIRRLDGRDAVACYHSFGDIISGIRRDREPALAVVSAERLESHTNADDHNTYRTPAEIHQAREVGDPLPRLRHALAGAGIDRDELDRLDEQIKTDVATAARIAQLSAEPEPVYDAKAPLPARLAPGAAEYLGDDSDERLTMLEAMRKVLRQRLADDPRVSLYGEDIEDPKGDVFGLTRGLSADFPAQVTNSPLAESTIVGAAIGRALAGGRPVAFLQFGDFLPIAYNQIVSELGSMYWRTDGAWQCPVIIMITCGGYRPGLGPFHAQTLESIAVHTPGVDVVMPSTAFDAAGLLNAAFESPRPTLFFYPKSCLNDRSATTSADVAKQLATLGSARTVRSGKDLTLVAYGNAVERCERAAEVLGTEGFSADVIDLRSLSPWDKRAVLDSVRKTGRLLVVHEDNESCGMAAEIITVVTEHVGTPVQCRRVTRADTYVPCNFDNQLAVLPSYQRVLETAGDMLGVDVDWDKPPAATPGIFVIEAVGSSPSDESIVMREWHVELGEEIAAGDLLASYEADKAIMDLESSAAGKVEALLAEPGDILKVGAPLLHLRQPEHDAQVPKPATREEPGAPNLHRRPQVAEDADIAPTTELGQRPVGLAGVATAVGSQSIDNAAALVSIDGKKPEDIERTTGIHNRRRISEGEDVVTLGARAARDLLEQQNLPADAIDLIICSTGTPDQVTPSIACRILYELAPTLEVPAYDINAACSGYIYALGAAYDFLQTRPDARVLVITSEVLSPLIDPTDYDTAIIFADAATATLVNGQAGIGDCRLRINRPALSGKGEPGKYLCVPAGRTGDGYVRMDGGKVFSEGVRKMSHILKQATKEYGIDATDLDLIIPHQANQRIIDAIRNRLNLDESRVYSNIRNYGNTSSSTIPLCLAELWPQFEAGQKVGLTAFGGGFTYAACVVDVVLTKK